MTVSLKGLALGFTVFVAVMIGFLTVTFWRIQHAAPPAAPGEGQPSWDLVSMFQHVHLGLAFWAVLFTSLVLGCLLASPSRQR